MVRNLGEHLGEEKEDEEGTEEEGEKAEEEEKEHLDGAVEVGLNDAAVVDEVDLGEHHGEVGEHHGVVAGLHGGRQVLVVLVQVDQAGPDEHVHGVDVPLDLVPGVHERDGDLPARPVGAVGALVRQGA